MRTEQRATCQSVGVFLLRFWGELSLLEKTRFALYNIGIVKSRITPTGPCRCTHTVYPKKQAEILGAAYRNGYRPPEGEIFALVVIAVFRLLIRHEECYGRDELRRAVR